MGRNMTEFNGKPEAIERFLSVDRLSRWSSEIDLGVRCVVEFEVWNRIEGLKP